MKGKTKYLKIWLSSEYWEWVFNFKHDFEISVQIARLLNRIVIKSHGTWIESRNVWIEYSLRFKSWLNLIAIWFRTSLQYRRMLHWRRRVISQLHVSELNLLFVYLQKCHIMPRNMANLSMFPLSNTVQRHEMFVADVKQTDAGLRRWTITATTGLHDRIYKIVFQFKCMINGCLLKHSWHQVWKLRRLYT